jgi:nucleoside-diphosphate-sugar epimerase
MKVAIFGAAGVVGRSAASVLIERGHSVRVVGRSRAKLEQVYGSASNVEILPADLASAADLVRAATGADAVLYSLGLEYTKKAFAAYPGMMKVAVDALVKARVRRLLHISNVYPYGRPRARPVREDHPLEPSSVKGRFRKEQEDVVRAAHASGQLQTIVLRPPDFYGPGALSLTTQLFEAAAKGQTANLLGPVDTPHQFVFVPDLGTMVAELLGREDVWGEVYNVPSAGEITLRAFAEKVFAAAGRPAKLRIAGPTMVRIMGLFSGLMRELVEMSYLLSDPVILDGSKLDRALGGAPKTPYDEGIRRTLDSLRAPPP